MPPCKKTACRPTPKKGDMRLHKIKNGSMSLRHKEVCTYDSCEFQMSASLKAG